MPLRHFYFRRTALHKTKKWAKPKLYHSFLSFSNPKKLKGKPFFSPTTTAVFLPQSHVKIGLVFLISSTIAIFLSQRNHVSRSKNGHFHLTEFSRQHRHCFIKGPLYISYFSSPLKIHGKRFFVRVDLNVPLDDNLYITDDTRIRVAVPIIK